MTTRPQGITNPDFPDQVLAGTFTFPAAISTVITDSRVAAESVITLIPTNAAAATLVGSSKSPYVSAKVAGVSFTVATASGVAASGTETFSYTIV